MSITDSSRAANNVAFYVYAIHYCEHNPVMTFLRVNWGCGLGLTARSHGLKLLGRVDARVQGPLMRVNAVIARESVFSQVHRYIRDKILRGQYPEGARLFENSIAAELNISRTPVREALVLLVGQDLVRTLEGGGFVVGDVRQQLLDILDIRVALESHAVAGAAADIGNNEIALLESLCRDMEALPPEEIDRRADLNRKFHETLIGASHNRRLVKMVGEYQDYFRIAQPLFDPEAIRRTQAEHRAITKALRERNIELAKRLVAEHIRNAGAHIMNQLTRNAQRPTDTSAAGNNDRARVQKRT